MLEDVCKIGPLLVRMLCERCLKRMQCRAKRTKAPFFLAAEDMAAKTRMLVCFEEAKKHFSPSLPVQFRAANYLPAPSCLGAPKNTDPATNAQATKTLNETQHAILEKVLLLFSQS